VAPTVLVPVGSLEQHGPHLPLDTDAVIASAVADRAAAALDPDVTPVLVAPVIAYGASGEHQDFPGTISVGHEALRLILVEMIRSLSHFAARIVLVNGHGGNVPTLRDAVVQMRREGHEVAWVPCAFETASDAHAGCDETSVMLHLDASRVAMDRAEAGRCEPLDELLPDLMAHGVRRVSPNGVLGDPMEATAARGERLLALLVDQVVGAVERGVVDDEGRLAVA
jgi:mycofactocin system creatininase family protein